MTNKAIVSRIRAVPKYFWVLLAIMIVGVFCRTYQFHDWLRFSPDEARDATYISDAITGKAPLPALGPQAGNTQFYLGPLYYQAEYVSALVFGNAPDKIAYFDLIFSILSIPMLFLFLRKYFSVRMSLFLSALLSVSLFAIQISRFASNPNTIPFFTLLFLYGLLGLADNGKAGKYRSAISVGVGMGVGIQLHTLLFLIMPLTAVGMCVYLLVKKNLTWQIFVVVLSFFLLMNYGQISYELRTGGANSSQLFRGAGSESSVQGNTLLRNISLITSCQMQANTHIIFSAINVQECGGMFNIAKSFKINRLVPAGATVNGVLFIAEMIATLLFSIGGYVLAIRALRKEPREEKRTFLGLILFYNFISFIVLVPVASQIEVRYFSILFFIPFILLGLWLDTCAGKKMKAIRLGAADVLVMVMFLFVNVSVLIVSARPYVDKSASSVDDSILGEAESMVAFLIANTDSLGTVHIDGSTMYLKRFLKPFDYIAKRSGSVVVRPGNKEPFVSGTRFFYIDGIKSRPYMIGDKVDGNAILGYERFGRIMIYTLMKK